MENGDFIYIEYVGRIKDTGEIFDLTREDVAKKEKIHNDKVKYGSVPFIVDAGFVIRGLNECVKGMKIGGKKEVDIEPDMGFGKRSEEMVKIIPEARFKERGINTMPGSFVTVNNFRGKILSVDGGRVKIDFNHPLAGKTLTYEIEILKTIEAMDEKIKAVIYYFTGLQSSEIDVKVDGITAEIELKEKIDLPPDAKKAIADQIMKLVKEIEMVKFVDSYGKPK
jgi:FKBP-type peptidyl-prolyl cis-trans isomerase 2